MILAAICAAVILKFGFSGARNFEHAALGTLTVHYQSKDLAGLRTHTIKQVSPEIEDMLAASQGDKGVTFILGNSQTHAINQKLAGEVVYPELLQRQFPNLCVLTNSIPNANLQEFHVILRWWMDQANIKTLLLPVFMDDLREDGLRKEFFTALIDDSFSLEFPQDALESEWNKIFKGFGESPQENVAASEGIETPQDIVEREINGWLNAQSETWRNRPNARGDFFMKLYRWRNTLFDINASTKRKMIPARLEKNFLALRKTLALCETRAIQVVLYIPPIRTDVEVPYDLQEYKKFKNRAQLLSKEFSQVQFKNFESIVPGEYWGLKASTDSDSEPELDFMHFQFAGHQILADSLATLLHQP